MKDCYLGIYWGKRYQTVDECLQKAIETFVYLKSIDESFNEWFQTSKPKKGQPITSIDLSKEAIKSLFLNGQIYNDMGKLMEDLGYSLYLKSHKDFSIAHVLSVKCGGFNDKLTNSVVLSISKADEYSYLIDKAILMSIYRNLVKIWRPERGIIKCQDEDLLMLSESYN